MSIRVRNGVSVGPFRYNASSLGITVSAMVKGIHASRGPRGNYVRVGRNGLYFHRIYHPAYAGDKHLAPPPAGVMPFKPGATVTPLVENRNAAFAELVTGSSAELLSEINAKLKKPKLAPYLFLFSLLVLVILAWAKAPTWLVRTLWFAGLALTVAAHYRDVMRRTVVILYDFAPPAATAYGQLYKVLERLKLNRQNTPARAVAQPLLKWTIGKPPLIKANVDVPVCATKKRKLVFLPDRLLIFEGKRAAAVSYRQLQIDVASHHYLQPGSLPGALRRVGHTRHTLIGNHTRPRQTSLQLPVTAFETIRLRSLSGLDETFQVAKPGSGRKLQRAVKQLGSVLA